MEKRKEDQEDLRLNKQTMFKMEVRELKSRQDIQNPKKDCQGLLSRMGHGKNMAKCQNPCPRAGLVGNWTHSTRERHNPDAETTDCP